MKNSWMNIGRRMEQKTGQLKKYEDKIREQDEMIQTYANSTSWKITEPMRKIMRLLKKVIYRKDKYT